MIDFDKVKHFKRYQFDHPDVCKLGSGYLMDEQTVIMLDDFAYSTGWEIVPLWSVGGGVIIDTKTDDRRLCLDKYHLKDNGCKAVDFFFNTDAHPKIQVREVLKTDFNGIGIFTSVALSTKDEHTINYLPVAFHVDTRPVEEFQIWTVDGSRNIHNLFNK